jgi:hypothetical protein
MGNQGFISQTFTREDLEDPDAMDRKIKDQLRRAGRLAPEDDR